MQFVCADVIRSRFADAMSAMYRAEVPAYGTLLEIVAAVNAGVLAHQPEPETTLQDNENLQRLAVERHGAIRLGTAAELATMRRVFAVLGMFPVAYYDLAPAGMPVHSTAFRPLSPQALRNNPFRVFTSLLRLELVADDKLREQAGRILAQRKIFTERALQLLEMAERQGGLTAVQAEEFVAEILHTFRWHAGAQVSLQTYRQLHDAHRLIADIVSFRGPHINHLTPRTLDIEQVQRRMTDNGIEPKAVIEGPPLRTCPVLLRQTSFRALSETVMFPGEQGATETGQHTARFGEVEQRGVALTPKGRDLYDRLLAEVRATIMPAADGSNAAAYPEALSRGFAEFPDDWRTLLDQELAYFTFSLTAQGQAAAQFMLSDLSDFSVASLLDNGLIRFDPLIYEDFLPVSAAGIFQSNLGDSAVLAIQGASGQQQFEAALGCPVQDAFHWYAKIQADSLQACIAALQSASGTSTGI